jgi:transposase
MSKARQSAVFSKMHQAAQRPVVVSLDVHDESTYMFSVDTHTGEIKRDCRVMGHYRKVLHHLDKLGPRRQISVLVEAGPHGYAPWRCFTEAGYTTYMIVPGSIPNARRAQKTDRDDAIENLNYHCSGLLRYVHVPDIEDERMRECLRERQHVMWAVTKEKQKLLSLLKRQGVEYNLTKTNWTKTHYRWLGEVSLPLPIRSIVDIQLQRIDHLGAEAAMLWRLVDDYLNSHPHHSLLRYWYTRMAGVGPILSATLVIEGGDLGRFAHPKPWMKFTGLIPGKRQSGGKDPALHITKTGNKYLRTALVGIAKYYQDYRYLHKKEDIEKLPPILQEFIHRSQQRLFSRYHALRRCGKRSTKARVAVARELAAFVWELATIVVPQLEQSSHQKAA